MQIPSLKAIQAKTPTVSSHTYKKIHGLTAVQSFNYGLRTKTRVTLDQILNTKTKADLYSYIKKQDTLFCPDVKKEDIVLNQDTSLPLRKTESPSSSANMA
ncbi:hypothetical protein MMJ09_10440 [Bacillus vallismortis]|nr:hypothetical protein [Bacillus vallismortis]